MTKIIFIGFLDSGAKYIVSVTRLAYNIFVLDSADKMICSNLIFYTTLIFVIPSIMWVTGFMNLKTLSNHLDRLIQYKKYDAPPLFP